MTTLHSANLPSMRKQFYDISQKDMESVLAYTSRVDVIVATMAKLGEQVSPGAWIYALGNGLRSEYKDTKDGILYNKQGYETVLSVKTKILSEEAILKDKRAAITKELVSTKEIHDEIAMKIAAPTPSKAKPPADQAQFSKGKDGKKGGSKGQRQWVDRPTGQNDWTNWQPQQSWTPTPTGTTWQPLPQKGKGKQPFKTKLWCDIHQAYGHSTDWCFDNPHRSSGPPKQEWNPHKSGGPTTQEWCDNHQTYGHPTEACRKGNGQAPPPQQQGHLSHANVKGGGGACPLPCPWTLPHTQMPKVGRVKQRVPLVVGRATISSLTTIRPHQHYRLLSLKNGGKQTQSLVQFACILNPCT